MTIKLYAPNQGLLRIGNVVLETGASKKPSLDEVEGNALNGEIMVDSIKSIMNQLSSIKLLDQKKKSS